MATNYILSENIKIFPAGFRGTGYIDSKLTSEQYLTSLNRLSKHINNNNFLIEDYKDTTKIILGINGYIFNIPKTSISGNNLKAYIKLRNINSGKVLANIVDESKVLDDDVDSMFKGLGITSDVIITDVSTDTYACNLTDSSGNLIYQAIRMSTDEIRNSDTEKAISELFATNSLEVNDSIIVKGTGAAGGNNPSIKTAGGIKVAKNATIGESLTVGGKINNFTLNSACEKEAEDSVTTDTKVPTNKAIKEYANISTQDYTINIGDYQLKFEIDSNNILHILLQ